MEQARTSSEAASAPGKGRIAGWTYALAVAAVAAAPWLLRSDQGDAEPPVAHRWASELVGQRVPEEVVRAAGGGVPFLLGSDRCSSCSATKLDWGELRQPSMPLVVLTLSMPGAEDRKRLVGAKVVVSKNVPASRFLADALDQAPQLMLVGADRVVRAVPNSGEDASAFVRRVLP